MNDNPIETISKTRGSVHVQARVFFASQPPNPLELDGDGHLVVYTRANHEVERERAARLPVCFRVEKYEHGMVRYALSGEISVDRAWDVTPEAGFWYPCESLITEYAVVMAQNGEAAARAFLVKAAEYALESYSNWCNGEVYAFSVSATDSGEADGGEADDDWDRRDGPYYTFDDLRGAVEDALCARLDALCAASSAAEQAAPGRTDERAADRSCGYTPNAEHAADVAVTA